MTAKEDMQLNTIARAVLSGMETYFELPEHQEAFERWKAEREKKQGKEKQIVDVAG